MDNSTEHQASFLEKDQDSPSFENKFKELLATIEFEEGEELFEARIAAIEALTRNSQDSELIQRVWLEYAEICERVVDRDNEPENRAKLQIAVLLHKALIFREVGDLSRYCKELSDIRDYAFNIYLDEVFQIINNEVGQTQT